jgi:hypothetical protein
LKKSSTKGTADYTISKLLLNSLYGRFGMNPDKENHEIVKGQDEISKYIKLNNDRKIEIKDFTSLDKDIELISFTKNKDYEEELSSTNNISVSISSSITAYARIKMSEMKSIYNKNIYYTDTDSIDLDIMLPDKYVSNSLGDYKLENKFLNVVYIAPKVYAATFEGIDKKNNKIIKEHIVIKGYKDENVEFNKIANILNENKELVLEQEK